MYNKYLVCRVEATRPHRSMLNNSMFPIIVEVHINCENPYESALYEALDSINPGYRPEHEYIVVPLQDALVCSITTPKPPKTFQAKAFTHYR